MSKDLILHHHDPSPFAEKIRRVFGIKGLKWRSVQIPMAMPKPDLTCLTGGYRGTPVLQIGADIYCDTRLILRVLEERHPEPALLKSGALANFGLQHWSDEAVFAPGAALAMYENAEHLPDGLLKEREAYFTNLDFSTFKDDAPHFRAQLRAHAALIDSQLADGRPFLLGDAPEWADIGAYFNIWMYGGHVPSAARFLSGLDRLDNWRQKMEAFGVGDRTDISAEDAHEIARKSSPQLPNPLSAFEDESGAAVGVAVTVTPDAHTDTPVEGTLAFISEDEIIVTRRHEKTGDVAVHFPRIGYRLALAR